MAMPAAARDTVFALRREIARIEGVLPDLLPVPEDDGAVVRGSGRVLGMADRLATGVAALDAALGGGLPRAALTEIHGREIRDAGAAAGFVLALAALLAKQAAARRPLLWIGTDGMFAEAGFPHLHGIAGLFGIGTDALLFVEAPRPVDALWIAEEAAALKALSAVILELPGNPQRLDLDATRRLHRRAVLSNRPVFLMRHSAGPEPTAAPLRFVVSPAPAGQRRILGRPLAGSIGPPAFTVTLAKNRLAPPTRLVLEWNPDELSFKHRLSSLEDGVPDPVALVSLSRHGADMAPAAGSRMAYDLFRFPAAGRQP